MNQSFGIYALLTSIILVLLAIIYMQRNNLPLKAVGQRAVYHVQTRPMHHLAIIMDGNRRWARTRGLPIWDGHKKGGDPLKMALEFCLEQQIPHLSVYAFSLENFNRSQEELDYLFSSIEKGIKDPEFQKLLERGICVHVIGEKSKYPAHLVALINELEQQTKDNHTLTFNIMFCYGGQQEITAAVKKIARHVEDGSLSAESITPELIQRSLWTHASPNPDLIIRTGKEKRLSNFLPWQSAYSELLFVDKYWPDITYEDLQDALYEFYSRERKFGR